ncbi:MAG: DNA polymerase III subunit gamma/tau [Acidimicrobiales bacterium]
MADEIENVPYQSLYRRFRPSTFSAVKGQDHVVLALRNAVRDHRVAHAYLFSGPRGTGKTSTARILAKALNCTDLGDDGDPCGSCPSCTEIARGTSLDVHELDAASNNGVDAMRDLVSRAALGTPGRQKVYIVDEVHMLSTAASNALLKTLEEPPPHVVFVLATTDPQKVLPTIRSRTQHFEFRLLGPEVLGELLAGIRRHAGLDVPDEALDLAVRRGRGSARDALSVLDQVAATDSIDDDLPDLGEVIEALADHDVQQALVALGKLISAGFSPQQLATDLVDHLRQGFLALVAPDLVTVSPNERDELGARAVRVGLAAMVRAMEVVGRAQVAMRDSPDPRVGLEVALIRLTLPEADQSPEALLVRIERLESRQGAPAPERPAPNDQVVAGPTRQTVAPPGQHAPTVPGAGSKAERGVISGSPAPADPAASRSDRARPPATGGTSEVPFPTRDELVTAWGDHILGRLRPKPKALYQAGRFVGVEGEEATYGLPNESHRKRCEEVRPDVEAVLSDHFRRPVTLKLVVDPGSAVGDSPSERVPGERRGSTGRTPRRSASGTATVPPPAGESAAHDPGAEGLEVLDEVELGEVVDVDNSARARLLQAFPGAEEVR